MASTILSDNGVSSGSAGIKTTADSTGALALQTTTAGGAATTAVTIDTSQNVGIGTASPSQKLDVTNGSASANCIIKITNSGTWGAYMQGVTSNRTFSYGAFDSTNGFASGSWGVRDETAAAWRMMIDSSGNLLVGATATSSYFDGIANFAGRIHTKAAASNYFWQTGAGNQTYLTFVSAGTPTVTGTISTNGTTTAYNTSSDYRLKENITPMTGALNKVSQLKPVTYKWKFDGADGEGFIAHELQEVVPDCVTGEKDGVETYTDEDGNEQTRPKYQGVDTSFLVATLTAAIQELKALTDTQASTITALTARIETLENKT